MPKAKPPFSGKLNGWVVAVLFAAFALLLFFQNSNLKPTMPTLWLTQAFFREPVYCFGEDFRGSFPKSGPAYQAFSATLTLISEDPLLSIKLGYLALSLIEAFFIYLVLKRIRKSAFPLLFSGLFTLQNFAFRTDWDLLNASDFMMQSALSIAAAFLALLLIEEHEQRQAGRLSILFGLVCGIGISVKISFILFLAPLVFALLILPSSRKNAFASAPAFLLFLAVGALPFLAFNLANDFPTISLISLAFDPGRQAQYNPRFSQYSPFSFPENLQLRISQFSNLGIGAGWFSWVAPIFLLFSLLYSLVGLFRGKTGGTAPRAFLALSASAYLVLTSFSYHELFLHELYSGEAIFFVAMALPFLGAGSNLKKWASLALVCALFFNSALPAFSKFSELAKQTGAPPKMAHVLEASGVERIYGNSCLASLAASYALHGSKYSLEYLESLEEYYSAAREPGVKAFVFENQTTRNTEGWRRSESQFNASVESLKQIALSENRSFSEISGFAFERQMRVFVIN